MAGRGVKGIEVPPDINFKCHPTKRSGIVVCALCDAIYHKGDYLDLKKKFFLTDLLVICDEHKDIELTSVNIEDEINYTNRVLFARQRKDLKTAEENLDRYRKICTKLSQEKVQLQTDLEKYQTNNLTPPTDDADPDLYWKRLVNELTDKNSILKELNLALKENEILLKEKIENLEKDKTLLEKDKLTSNTSTPTYSEITANLTVPLPSNIPSILIKTNEENITTVSNKIKNILYKDSKVQINKLICTKNKVIINCKQEKNIAEVCELIREKTEDNISIETQQLKKPKLKVLGIDKDLANFTNDELKKELYDRNDWDYDSFDCKILNKFKNTKLSCWNLIIEVNTLAYEYIMERKSISFGYNSWKVIDDFNLNPCYKCGKYFHSAKKCTAQVCCLICSGNHLASECNNKTDHKCINCIIANNKYNTRRSINHDASNLSQCESYQYLLQRQIKNTVYPYNPLVNGKS